MPFKSTAQMKWMFANHPKMAKQWASDTPNISSLPDKAISEGFNKAAKKKKKKLQGY